MYCASPSVENDVHVLCISIRGEVWERSGRDLGEIWERSGMVQTTDSRREGVTLSLLL